MNAQSKKLTQLAASILMVLAVGNVYSADPVNNIYIDGVGDYNQSNLDVSGDGADVKIDQISSATAVGEKNSMGTTDVGGELTITSSDSKIVRIGQGAFYNPANTSANPTLVNNGLATDGAKSNTVSGIIANGTVVVNQTSSGNTVNFTGTGVTGTGAVTVKQGFQDAAGGGGSGFTANIAKSGTGSLTVEQGNAASNPATSGTVNVIQGAGSSDVTITQLADTGVTNSGIVSVNTTGSDGRLTITQTDNGRTYVNSTGVAAVDQTENAALSAATITNTVALINDMNNGTAGKLALKSGKGNVEANVTGSGGTVIIDSNGGGSNNNIYINADGATGNASALTVTGTLTVAQTGNDNSTVAVKAGLTGTTSVIGTVNILQTGNYQVATFTATNGSWGNYNLNQSGTLGSNSVINVDF